MSGILGMKTLGGMDVREWRHARGLSQSQLARLLGVESVTISRWERGTVKRGYSDQVIELALEALDRRLKEQKEAAPTV